MKGKSMKKIIIFGYNLNIGGAEKVLVDFIKVLQKDYEIDLVLLRDIGELKKDLPKSVNIIEIRKSTLTYLPFRYTKFWRRHVINKIVNSKDYDVGIRIYGRKKCYICC